LSVRPASERGLRDASLDEAILSEYLKKLCCWLLRGGLIVIVFLFVPLTGVKGDTQDWTGEEEEKRGDGYKQTELTARRKGKAVPVKVGS
jgi:hypothetical protein